VPEAAHPAQAWDASPAGKDRGADLVTDGTGSESADWSRVIPAHWGAPDPLGRLPRADRGDPSRGDPAAHGELHSKLAGTKAARRTGAAGRDLGAMVHGVSTRKVNRLVRALRLTGSGAKNGPSRWRPAEALHLWRESAPSVHTHYTAYAARGQVIFHDIATQPRSLALLS
jgi:hypothetical protein